MYYDYLNTKTSLCCYLNLSHFLKDIVIRRQRPSIDYRVPIDFSGNESRVVSDPDAAQAVKDSISSKLPVNYPISL